MLQMARDLKPSIVRFGGNFTSGYHWRDGIGPREKRVSELNLAWGIPEYNTFGTDEFLRFCELIHAQPQIALNLGTGTPEEAADWVKYVNEHWADKRGGLLVGTGQRTVGQLEYRLSNARADRRTHAPLQRGCAKGGPQCPPHSDGSGSRPLSGMERRAARQSAGNFQLSFHAFCGDAPTAVQLETRQTTSSLRPPLPCRSAWAGNLTR